MANELNKSAAVIGLLDQLVKFFACAGRRNCRDGDASKNLAIRSALAQDLDRRRRTHHPA